MKSCVFLSLLVACFCGISSLAQESNDSRKWTSSDGSRTFEGKAVKYTGKEVTIARTGQSPKVFPVDIFSNEDKNWLETNKERLQNSSLETKKDAVADANAIGKQFGEMTYSMLPKTGINGTSTFSWGKKPVKATVKYYILLYTASWCPYCVEEMPNTSKLYSESIASDPDIELILCSSDSDEKDMKSWAKKEKISFPILPKDKRKKVEIVKELSPKGIPSGFLVEAATGKVVCKASPTYCYKTYLRMKKEGAK